jgi:hypothetical protein
VEAASQELAIGLVLGGAEFHGERNRTYDPAPIRNTERDPRQTWEQNVARAGFGPKCGGRFCGGSPRRALVESEFRSVQRELSARAARRSLRACRPVCVSICTV